MTRAWLGCVAVAGCTGAITEPVADDAGTARPRVVINEFMAADVLTTGEDWVELWNAGDEAVDVSGWTVAGVPLDGALAAGEFRVVSGMSLDREGGEVELLDAAGDDVDRVAYGVQPVDLAYARLDDGWGVVWRVTPGAANRGATRIDGDPTELLLGDDAFPRFALIVPPASEEALRVDPRAWVEASIVFDGRTLGPVGVRLKGQNSFQPYDAKPSWKIKMDAYVPGAELLGLEDLTLNAMNGDDAMLRERLAYAFARARGVPAPRCTHAWVEVNGSPYGLYAHVETVTPRMLARWFADRTGPLHEGTDADFVATLIPVYEHEAGTDDRTALTGLADALTLTGDAALAAAATHADLDAFLRYWATMAVIGQFDGYPYSTDDYFVYREPGGRLHAVPWGTDETWYRWWRSILEVQSVLAQRCLAAPSCRQAFVDEVWAAEAALRDLDVAGEIDRLAALVAPHAAADPRKPHLDVGAGQEAVRVFVARRPNDLTFQLVEQPAP